jgi:hypothetical protein
MKYERSDPKKMNSNLMRDGIEIDIANYSVSPNVRI